MNAPVTTTDRRISQVELYVSEVLPEDSPVLRALPAGIDPKRFKNSLQIAVMVNPQLLKCDPRLTFREVARVANYGLSLDPSMGEAWLILRRSSKTGRDEPQAQLGYRGKLKLARQSGEVARIAAYPVSEKCAADGRFKVTLREIFYEPDVFNDETPPAGYFAYVLYKDGTEDYEIMSIREIHKIRDRSDGYKAFKKGSIKSTPWSDYEGEMAKKTVLSRLMKRVPMSADLVEFLRKDEMADYAGVIDDTPPAPQLAPPRRGRPPGSRNAVLQEIAAPKAQKNKPQDEPETEEEQIAESVDTTLDPQEGSDDEPVIDTTSPDYARGQQDFNAGLKKCLNPEIRSDPARLANWHGGWSDARDGADEAMNGRDED
jgi:recombination protein RecT